MCTSEFRTYKDCQCVLLRTDYCYNYRCTLRIGKTHPTCLPCVKWQQEGGPFIFKKLKGTCGRKATKCPHLELIFRYARGYCSDEWSTYDFHQDPEITPIDESDDVWADSKEKGETKLGFQSWPKHALEAVRVLHPDWVWLEAWAQGVEGC